MTQNTASGSLQVSISYRQILSIALPISFAILVPQLNFITNNIFLGHFDTDSLAIAGITGVYYLIFAAIGYGLNNGMQALISRRAGENKPQEIGIIFKQGVFISLVIASIGILLTYTLAPYILRSFITNAAISEKAIRFLHIRIWGLLFLYIYQMRNALLVGIHRSKYLILGTLAEAVSNIVLDYLFIFGHAGFPALGFFGAAYASIFSEFIGMITVFGVIQKTGISKEFHIFGKGIRVDVPYIKRILSISAPLIFQHAISIIGWVYFFLLIEAHGSIALAVSNTMRNVFGFFGAFTWAFAATSNTMVSNLMGQGKHDQVRSLLKRIVTLSTGFSICIALLLTLFPHLFLGIYGQGQPFETLGRPVLKVVSVAMIMMSVSTVYLNAVTGTGNSRTTFLIELFSVMVYGVYVYFVLHHYFLPITYGWMSEWIYWILLFIPSFLYMRSSRWKQKKI